VPLIAEPVAYLDSSTLVKLVVREPESRRSRRTSAGGPLAHPAPWRE
jgi:hypothetical protein